jgi:hypothetical protein
MLPRLLPLLWLALPTLAQTGTTIVPASADTTLYEDPNGAFANGLGESLFVGRIALGLVRRTLLHFDVAALVPNDARIVSAELHLTVARAIVATPVVVTVHRVLQPWPEGTANATFGREGQGTLAGPGDCTWLHRDRPGLLWNTPGGDFAAPALTACPTPDLGLAVWPSTPAVVDEVQRWLATPTANFGWLLRTDERVPQEARRFDSRQTPIAGAAPVLHVTWLRAGSWLPVGPGCGTPPPVLGLTGPVQTGAALQFHLQGPPLQPAAFLLAFALQQPVWLAPNCAFLLGPAAATLAITSLDATGTAAASLQVPAGPAFAGLDLAAQAATLAGPAPGFAMANALALRVQ